MAIITISRLLGSDGATIAEQVAQEMSYNLVTKRTLEKILEQYGSKNKSVWIGEVIEQWYLNNITEADRLDNKMKWLELKKEKVENEIRNLQEQVYKLEGERLDRGK